ncbi:hypothetical protein L6164_023499 [Bauhinia variegata]|uniref:Uncharacterized protein n=1 Tax=Bauhinia variegata TaxID=167791 RepID=A0ACB9MLT3_BAUVA|nr:hypothetical protein L6164_023499 [Bauhinia variegata]
MFGSDEDVGTQIPTEAQSIVEGSGSLLVSEFKPVPDPMITLNPLSQLQLESNLCFYIELHNILNLSSDIWQALLAIQQQGPRAIGFFGTRKMEFMHSELIEILSYAMVITVRCLDFTLVQIKI